MMAPLCLAFCLLPPLAWGQRLLVLPDVHGDLEALRGALELGNVTPGGDVPADTTVVSLGDLVDRGPSGPGCYEELKGLAARGDGRVLRLLGNHEWLNLLGVDERDHWDTPGVRENLLASYVHPEEIKELGGWPGRMEAFRPQGSLGAEIAGHFQLLALLPRPHSGGSGLPPLTSAATLLLHGGISAATARSYGSAEDLAMKARKQLETWAAGDGKPDVLLPGPGGTELFDELLQDRNLAEGPESSVCPELEAVLLHFKAARLVLGHTPQLGGRGTVARRANVRCGGRLILLDVAMSRWLLNMRRPEEAPHSALLELNYRETETAGDVLKSLRVLYAGGDPEDLPPFAAPTRYDL